MESLLFLIVVLALGAALYIRFAPSDPDRWHVEPAEGEDPSPRGIRMIGREAPRFPGHPVDVLSTFIEIAEASPRTRRLDGGVDEGLVTFVTRTPVLGAPDYTTVMATDEGTETKLAILARSRFGFGDLDANRKRVEGWLQELDRALR